MQAIPLGKSSQVSALVHDRMLAISLGTGDVGVCATSVMSALMERAAYQCVAAYLDSEETTVSAQIEVTHISAVPLGTEITATAEVIKVVGKKIWFKVFCEDRNGIVGKGTHLRLVVNRNNFQHRAQEKKNSSSH